MKMNSPSYHFKCGYPIECSFKKYCGRQKVEFQESPYFQTTKDLYPTLPRKYNEKEAKIESDKEKMKAHGGMSPSTRWATRVRNEAKAADEEFKKFSMEIDPAYQLVIPDETGSFYWIPGQFSPWRWNKLSVPRQKQSNPSGMFQNENENPMLELIFN